MDKTSLGDRMKRYERVVDHSLMRRSPVIIRVDGRAFSSFTRRHFHAEKFSSVMHIAMLQAALNIMKQAQNAVLAYTQSDEISILLVDWKQLTTEQWFGARVQKITSISASLATSAFTYALAQEDRLPENLGQYPIFDARVFNLPKEEVTNYFIWRQQDATRNSINMLGQMYFSHNELQGKSTSDVQDMLMLEKGVNWNDLDVWKKRGTCVVAKTHPADTGPWVDDDIPIFTQNREYIERWLDPNYLNME